jgi:hypothetical protein
MRTHQDGEENTLPRHFCLRIHSIYYQNYCRNAASNLNSKRRKKIRFCGPFHCALPDGEGSSPFFADPIVPCFLPSIL